MRTVLFVIMALVLFVSCNNETTKVETNVNPNDREVTVKDLLQVSAYTYLYVSENDQEYWIAVSRMEAKKGDVYHFSRSMEMKDFHSKDLDRTFEKVLFVGDLSKDPIPADQGQVATMPHESIKHVASKKEVNVERREGTTPIADIYANRAKYENQVIRVVGQVTKVNSGIMGRNWIHLQDGTSDGDNFDLTITTHDLVNVGETVEFEGKIFLKKDFGAGYSYEVIMEEASVKTNATL